MFKKLLSLAMATIMVMGMGTTAFAAIQEPDSILFSEEEIQEFYSLENLNYINEMPLQLANRYEETIALADRYLASLYGDTAMLSTDSNFALDKYCQGIKLGLCLDLNDEDLVNALHEFANAASKEFIVSAQNRCYVPVTEESSEPFYPLIQPRLNASGYNATNAVKYARDWTEEGKTLTNPNFKRYDADCTNFVSQVLYAGGISQISGNRKDDSSWYYEWGLIARPSYTWGGAQNLYNHLESHSTNIERITSTANLKVGDIISFDIYPDDNNFHIGHNVVVTKKEGNTWDKIYLTYHTTDREDYPASNLIGGNNRYIPYAWTTN